MDYYLTHDRRILNRCDDSVVRDGFIIRLSRGIAPKRTRIDLGPSCILGVGPELNSNITIYKDGYAITSPHVGHVRNPPTLAYLEETAERIRSWLGARYEVIGHDLHPSFLSTGYARALAEETGAELVPVQHHRAHVAATTLEPCIGITIDGVGYGDDGKVWGGEVFAGEVPHLSRVAHLEEVPMPGGDLATRFPERMLYGILPEEGILEILRERRLDRYPGRRPRTAGGTGGERGLDIEHRPYPRCRGGPPRDLPGENLRRRAGHAPGGRGVRRDTPRSGPSSSSRSREPRSSPREHSCETPWEST